MAEVVLDMIALIFERVEGLVFDFPAGAAALHQLAHIVFTDRDVAHPTVVIGDFLTHRQPVLKEIELIGIAAAIERHLVEPAASVPAALSIGKLQAAPFPQATELINPFKQQLVIRGFGHQDEGHAGFLQRVDKGLIGV